MCGVDKEAKGRRRNIHYVLGMCARLINALVCVGEQTVPLTNESSVEEPLATSCLSGSDEREREILDAVTKQQQ